MAKQMEGVISEVRGFSIGGKRLFASEHPRLWMLLLIGIGFVSSLQSACATPLVGLSVAGALAFSRRMALVTAMGLWAVNQVTGFAFQNYPQTENTALWGLIMGIAIIGSAYMAQWVSQFVSGQKALSRSASAFGAGFLIYEGVLFGASLGLGGTAAFTLPILSQVFAVNAIVFGILFLAKSQGR